MSPSNFHPAVPYLPAPRRSPATWAATCAVLLLVLPWAAWPHGYAGRRVFPATFKVAAPFVMDELTLLASHWKLAGAGQEPARRFTGLFADYTARLTPRWGVTVGGEFRRVEPDGGPAMHGFGNLLVGTKYQFFTSAPHEAIVSVGVDADVGTTGDRRVGAEPWSVISPALFFGKGLGDLPEWAKYGRPLAVTGTLGVAVPTDASVPAAPESPAVAAEAAPAAEATDLRNERVPTRLLWGLTVQYDLAYLQTYVEDVGLAHPFDQMIPLVEFAMTSCLGGDCAGQTDGTVNPGLIWLGHYVQFGLAARIPVNSHTDSHVGVMGLFNLFVDDLLGHHEPHSHDPTYPHEHPYSHEHGHGHASLMFDPER